MTTALHVGFFCTLLVASWLCLQDGHDASALIALLGAAVVGVDMLVRDNGGDD